MDPTIHRREFLDTVLALSTFAFMPRRELIASIEGAAAAADLVKNPLGGYSFLPGLPMVSFGVRASAGFEIVHARFRKPLPLEDGFDAVAAHLKGIAGLIRRFAALSLDTGDK